MATFGISGLKKLFGKEETITAYDLSDHHPLIANIKIVKKDSPTPLPRRISKRNKKRINEGVIYGDRRPLRA